MDAEADEYSSSPYRPIRVLHVVGSLDVGGIETWLVQILERLDRSIVACDVVVQRNAKQDYASRVRATGASIFVTAPPTTPWRYAASFRRILRQHGPYDVVHAHPHHWCGIVMRLAHQEKVAMRIAHSRNDLPTDIKQVGLLRGLYYRLMKRWILRYMTHGLAVSSAAGRSLFGPAFTHDPRCAVLPSGIDLTPFESPVDRRELLDQLRLPADAKVIGHVGRFTPIKNQIFVLEIMRALADRDPHVHLLLIGDGPMRPAVEQRVAALDLNQQVHLLGQRKDVARLMKGAFDVLVLPSLWEGLPRVVNEAQAAGVPAVFSDHFALELDVVKPLIHRIPLHAPAQDWANVVLSVIQNPRPIQQGEALAAMRTSPASIASNVRRLEVLYGQLSS